MERTEGNGKGQLTQSTPKAYTVSAYAPQSNRASYGRSLDAQGYRKVIKMNTEDKQSGSYERYTAREEVSTGEMHRGRGHREHGVKDEYKTSSTLKVGDKSSYTEYYKEERVRNVSYGGGSHNAGGGVGKTIEYGTNKNNYNYGGGGKNDSYGVGGNKYDDGYGSDASDNCDFQSDDNVDGNGDDGQSCSDDHLYGGETYSDASAGRYGDDDGQSCSDGHSDGSEAYSDASAGSYDDDNDQSCSDDHSDGGEIYSDASAGSYDDDYGQSYGSDSDY